MAIGVKALKDGYWAEITPPHIRERRWESLAGISRDALIKQLSAIGCHQTDIGDAFYEADPDWLRGKRQE